jgi:hypothetical protein
VTAVAEGLILAEAATAKADDGTTAEAKLLAFGVLNAEVPFDT